MTAIAIVGMGCRIAGGENLQSYWKLMLEGRDAFGPIPADRWPADIFFDKNRRATDKSYAPHGAFLSDIRGFPAIALGLPPRRVEVMDPQQRLALEVALQATEDAGYRPSELPRKTGVYVGVTATEYRSLSAIRIAAVLMASGHLGEAPQDPTAIAAAVENMAPSRPYAAPGGLGNMCAAIVAQELDLHGPAYTTDAACASAHMAIYDAVQQLRTGAIDAALAGGTYAQILPDHYVVFSRIGAMSAKGYCRPFDSRADGFVQGDGAGIVLLKRLADAERDGDRIYAVIEGVAINNDGRGDGPMSPDSEGQAEVIRDALSDAGLSPDQIQYIEAHGTGTPVGDPAEIASLKMVFGDRDLPVGSAKANVGHLMSAAGIAGLLRTTLAVHHKTIPPMAGFGEPSEKLGLNKGGLRVPKVPEAWTDPNRAAGCSAFGFGGTNGHIVVRAYNGPTTSVQPAPQLLLMSAHSEDSLRALAAETAEALSVDKTATLAGACRAWSHRRRQSWRLSIVADSLDHLVENLRLVGEGSSAKGVRLGHATSEPKIAFMYPGQGAQRVGMLRDSVQRFPVLSQALDALEGALGDDLSAPLTHLLYPERRGNPVSDDVAAAELTDTAACQPAMLAVGVALTQLLDTVGVKPTVVVGHSLGEFTAASVGGVFSAADAARFVAARGRAMAQLQGDHGTMAALMADRRTAEPLLVEGAILANFNHPRQLVVSGFTDAIAQVISNAEAAGVKAVPLAVSHGFHSPALANLDSAPLLDGVQLNDPVLPIASGIHDGLYTDRANARDIFMRHATSPVEFVRALHQCRDAGADLYLQIGAGGPLASFARGALPRDHKGVLTLAGKRDDDGGRSILQTLGQLWTLGVNVDASAINQAALPSSLPPTVLPREPYWVIKDEPQLPLELKGIKPRKRAPAKVPQVQEAVAEGDNQSDDPVADKVIGIIAKVSAYPRSALRPEMSLIDDLGFDSLMVGDLATGLSESFAAIDGIPQELLINQPTVLDIIDFAKSAREGTTVQSWDDDAPLIGYALGWRDAEHPALPGRDLPIGLRVLLVDGTDAMAAAFEGDGAEVLRVDSAAASSAPPVDLVVWSALESSDDWDLAAPFIAALGHQASGDSQPDVLVLSNDGDPWAAGLHGVVRGLTREWPGCSATSLHLAADAVDQAGDIARVQWMSSDRSADIRYTGDVRQVSSHLPQPHNPVFELKGSRVLITGGTRGIGADVAKRLLQEGSDVVLVGRSAPGQAAQLLLDAHPNRAVCVLADVTDADQLTAAVRDVGPIHALVHCAGVLADGALQDVAPAKGRLARSVKAQGLRNAVAAAGTSLAVVVGVGSWAGRYGNRHQAHYGAANALLAALCDDLPDNVRGVTAEFGPWSSSDMVATIPAPVQAAMRAEGVDFVGDEAGLQTLIDCLTGHSGTLTMGRDLPRTGRAAQATITLSTTTHPYLLDHAIQEVPVLPLAGAADLLAWAVGAQAPFALSDLQLFQGVTVQEPVQIKLIARGDRVELRQGPRMALAYKCRVRPFEGTIEQPTDLGEGEPAKLSLSSFYNDVTFHGPLLQGIESIDAVADDNVRGVVCVGEPSDWIPATSRGAWAIDPLVLDSAMQLSGYVAWIRYQRAGTPVAMGRYVQLAPFEPGSKLRAQVTYGDSEGDRFSGDLWLRNDRGELLAVALNVVAELRQAEQEAEPPFVVQPEWLNFDKMKELIELENRLAMAQIGGIRNPYFRVQEGTARDTTVIEGHEYINYSSYNYIGLSGDPRVVHDVNVAVERYGTSVSASRVASGERPFHGLLEKELAACQRSDDAIVFTAGHATNVTTIGHLFGPDDLIMHDEYIHDSGLQGIKLSGANRRMFRHDDPAHLDEQLTKLRRHYKRCLILVEGVYSMDGDICNLPAYIELKRKHGCMVMVDEAHSFGIIGETGCGVAEYFDLKKGDIDLYMGTLSKSLSSCGGWIAADQRLITYLKYTAPGFIYSAGLTAANGVAALSSLRLMLEEPWRVKKLQHNARFFHSALTERNIDTGPADGESGVIPAVTGNSMHALQLSQRLNDAHINVQPIVYPAVPDDAARLRFFLSSTHSEDQLTKTADLVSQILTQVRADFPLPKRK